MNSYQSDLSRMCNVVVRNPFTYISTEKEDDKFVREFNSFLHMY